MFMWFFGLFISDFHFTWSNLFIMWVLPYSHIPMVSRNFRAQCAYLSGLRPCKVFLYVIETNLRNSAPNQSIQLKVETELITNNHFPASSQSVQVLRAICLVAIHRSKMMTDGCKKERKVGKELSNWVYIPLGHFQSNTSPWILNLIGLKGGTKRPPLPDFVLYITL